MSYNKEKGEFGEGPKIHRIRITLTSCKVQALEKGMLHVPVPTGEGEKAKILVRIQSRRS